MESSQRGALALVRLVAVCIILVGVMDAGMYLTQYVAPIFKHQPPAPLSIFRLTLDAIPLIVGIVILVKAKAVAEWLADMIE
jgi:hypothetical protein